MNKVKVMVSTMVSAMLLSGVPVMADESHHPDSAGATVSTTATADQGSGMDKMQERMRKMQQQMDEIKKTKDPKRRNELIDEHSRAMQEEMGMMRGMGGGMMQGIMGKGIIGGGMMGKGMMEGGQKMEGTAAEGDPQKRMNMMEQRMDMMQMMMEQMVQSRAVERGQIHGNGR